MFLDEGFAAESVAVRLRKAGFIVKRFHDWFKDENGQTKRNVPDPEIMRFCHKKGWLLLTRDHAMRNLHRDELRKTDIAVLATANNKALEQNEWVDSIIGMRVQVFREFKKRKRPWFATFSRAEE